MPNLSRRGFLLGSAAVAVAAAAPAGVAWTLPEAAPVFDGVVGVYNGIIIRETLSIDLLVKAKRLALGARPRIRPEGDYYYEMVWPTHVRDLVDGRG